MPRGQRLTAETKRTILEMYLMKVGSVGAIADAHKVHSSTVYEIIHQAGLSTKRRRTKSNNPTLRVAKQQTEIQSQPRGFVSKLRNWIGLQ